MGQITVLGDWVGLSLIWFQPIFWMVFYHLKTDRFNSVLKLQLLCAGSLILGELIPNVRNWMLSLFNSHRLLVMYSSLATVFTWFLMKKRGWNYPQAISIAFLTVFIGSFYWEIPYLIRNAFITGFEMDWFLHILFIFPVWYINDTIGWGGYWQGRFLLLLLGLIISGLYMYGYPVPPGRMDAAIWDSWYYLSNRVINTTLIFIMIKKDMIPYSTELHWSVLLFGDEMKW